jgi:hypothetical protein
MILIKRFLLASALLLSLASHSNAQETGTTGNLIQDNTWAGCWTATSGAFWGGQSGGPCPGISNGGYDGSNQIIFSYGQQTISQSYALSQVLPDSGTGLQVTGYNWHWHVKNSNINDAQPGSYDSIAYVTVDLIGSSGKVLVSDVYDYGYRIDGWINPSGTRTYDTPYSLATVSDIQLTITGKDDGFWAGYYGPEFQHPTLSVNYSVDPCASNPLHAPTCSGYLDALAALMPQSVEPTSAEPTAVVESSTPTAEVVATSPAPVVVTSSQTPTVTAAAPSSSRNTGSGLSIGSILSIVRNEQSRISSVESAAVQQANEQAAQATADAQQQAEAVASSAAVSSQSQLAVQSAQSQQSSVAMGSSSQSANEMYSLANRSETESATLSIGLTGNSPTGNLFESAPVVVQEQNNQTTESTVNSNVADNDIAGDVSIAALQVVPIGFDLYQVGLTDAAFYKTKDIYKNQKNVDNARAFRGLVRGDILHQQMVDQQYNRINN